MRIPSTYVEIDRSGGSLDTFRIHVHHRGDEKLVIVFIRMYHRNRQGHSQSSRGAQTYKTPFLHPTDMPARTDMDSVRDFLPSNLPRELSGRRPLN
jgi:hypothetical protein